MAFSVQMPALGESVTEGTVTRWLKQEGDRVEVDEPLLEVSTDKVDTEIPSPAAGVLERIVAGEDETVEVGGELAVIGDGAEGGGSGDGGGQDEGGGADDGDDDDGDDEGGDEGGDTPAEDATEAPAEEEADADEPPAPPNQAETAKSEPSSGEEPAAKPKADKKSTGAGTAVTMPELGESVTEGTVTRWLKQVGDSVEVDEPLLEVSTDKVDTEIPSPVAGTLLEITAAEDETVDVGGQLALIGDEAEGSSDESPDDSASDDTASDDTAGDDTAGDDSGDDSATDTDTSEEEPPAEEPADEPAEKPAAKKSSSNGQAEASTAAPADDAADQPADDGPPSGSRGAPYVTPLVRKLASEHGVDLSAVSGSGVGGRIRKQDVLAAAEAAKPEPEPEPEPDPRERAFGTIEWETPAEPVIEEPEPEPLQADEAHAVLTSVLDTLGAAHHRPFSRS
jgi:2-oxoglutarate dehydrogenase E2 component (dihydrolipoamide succinyltransferase)